MRTIFCISVWLVVLALTAFCLGWTQTRFHLTIGGSVVAIFTACKFIWWLRTPRRASHLQESLGRSLIVSILVAALTVGVIALSYRVAEAIPGVNPWFFDGDRPAVMAKVEALEQAGEFATAATLIETRLEKALSPEWEAVLELKLPELLVNAGMRCEDHTQRAGFFARARDQLQRAGKDPAAVQSLLSQAERDAQYQARILEQRRSHKWRELIDELRVAVKNPRESWWYPYDEWLYDAHLKAGQDAATPDAQQNHFREALAVAKTWELDPSHASDLLSQLLQVRDERERAVAELEHLLSRAGMVTDLHRRLELLEWALGFAERHGLNTTSVQSAITEAEQLLLPVELATGCQAKVLEVTHHAPFSVVDLAIAGPLGTPLLLKERDISARIGGQDARVCSVAVAPPKSTPMHVTLCLDISGSMAGAPVLELKRGVERFLDAVKLESEWVRLIPFKDRVLPLGQWSQDRATLLSHVRSIDNLPTLAVGGGTALVATLRYAAENFPAEAERRTVILMSDGADSRGRDPSNTVRFCQQAGVLVHVIGLRGENFDEAGLRRIAEETGGVFFEATKAEQLVSMFEKSSAEVQKRALRVLCQTSVPAPPTDSLELTIGRGPTRLLVTAP